MGRTSLYKLLKSIGFEFIKKNKLSIIFDRDDILMWRRSYLRSINKYRHENRHIFYLDKTWVNEGHTTSKVWSDSTIKTPKQTFLSGLTTGLKPAASKGKRLIIVHIGNENGFLNGGLLMFESKKVGTIILK